jgi:hydrogenase expression/formation protein HypC
MSQAMPGPQELASAVALAPRTTAGLLLTGLVRNSRQLYGLRMCLAVPMKVTSINGDRATAALGDVELEVGLALVPDVSVGDYVIVHAGFAIERLNEQDAQETLAMFAEMAKLDAEGEQP